MTVSLSDEQFAIWLRETERIVKEATVAHLENFQSNSRRPARKDKDQGQGRIRRRRRRTPHRFWSDNERDRLRELKNEGTLEKEIAIALGRTVSAIRQQWAKQNS